MPQVYLSLGSNVDRDQSIRQAMKQLAEQFGEMRVSTLYESDAVGFDGDAFYNLVVGFETDLGWQEIQQQLRRIEEKNGRERGSEKFSSRTLDIDLLIYGDLDLQHEGTDLPRAEIFKYAFVLKPLAEIAGDQCHPQTGESYSQLWRQFDQKGQRLRAIELSL
ncbi:MAG: 2-amino-4-hydroxy-6-hydroxymethyldihydropteridine diphosphokinase [Gammaproteobacteria bacterium]|jgi:2-amino-4-hydroxy-6-hydroxymethyldihydropteridine diphosphokinase|nr:2-amino-4-hydroxy-6-hydroxymethyldihydropteridine diphosphokinase [Gammaproteobacteria bacterium]MBT3489533.1 2-amino-4-hydroxy-6-hydroxymethyldihydropteridine diphosphokinase [Gammaproteobacteria bacterium]MBT3718873.1 2-amino-4-hydroxy-6-hydroxymethyldihydropteridine diphosphokinase [Gammaproteobacteria bacterium]MBT3845039.1 2-amino-4-hydroxy-6-hydroxymethyldihydropteridine diphosphokinase [Gammaproteobacteria bacterium]MBT3893628.1 2-amino-4-hydroxy-6-hydroxymethyldihydropteridine diphos